MTPKELEPLIVNIDVIVYVYVPVGTVSVDGRLVEL